MIAKLATGDVARASGLGGAAVIGRGADSAHVNCGNGQRGDRTPRKAPSLGDLRCNYGVTYRAFEPSLQGEASVLRRLPFELVGGGGLPAGRRHGFNNANGVPQAGRHRGGIRGELSVAEDVKRPDAASITLGCRVLYSLRGVAGDVYWERRDRWSTRVAP